MATIPSTKSELYADITKFLEYIGNTKYTQEQISGAHRTLNLRYLGLVDVDDEELETCAMFLQIATKEATARGWLI